MLARVLLLGLLLLPMAAGAQPARPPEPAARRLPADSVTHHVLSLPGGRELRFTAIAGAIRLSDPEGKPQADLAFVSYTLDGADPVRRPVTVAMNGGPGSGSAWLQLGALGPWRLPLAGDARRASAPPVLVDNAETWLDFTDLVFLDPPGTGYSRLADDTEALRRKLWSVNGDITALAEGIRRWLQANGRMASPKFFAGESYAGFRGPRLVRALANEQGVGLSGMLLISPVLDFGTGSNAFDPLGLVATLPSMAAAAHGWGPDGLAEVERYAAGDFLRDLLVGQRDPAVLDRVSARVAELTGLDPALVRRLHGRIPSSVFLRENRVAEHRIGSIYDATLTEADPAPESPFSFPTDPVFAGYGPPIASAMVDLVFRRLNWHPDGPYELSNNRVNREWDWGRGLGRPESMTALRADLALDPGFRAVVEHGVYDLITPYFRDAILLAQVPDYPLGDRLRLVLHRGGHMFYTNDEGRVALRDDARAMVAGQ